MAGTLRGSLGLKSGPLAPTSAKLTTQYLVLDHMNNHYRKISQAKSAIDNRPPKSITSSQKVRERKEREYIKKHGTSRPTSRMSGRPTSRNEYDEEDYDEAYWDDPEDDDERLVYSIMRTTLREDYPRSAEATMGSGSRQRGQSPGFNKTIRYQDHEQANAVRTAYYKPEPRPTSVRSNHSMMSAGSRTSLTGNVKKNTYDGDLLQKRSHVFTEPEKPFTPRTLKSNRQSRLSEYKYYTAPPKHRKQKQEDTDQTEKKLLETETNGYRPKPKPRGTGTLGMTDTHTLTESQLMYESLQSRDFRRHNKGEEDLVPKLDISVDKDHMNWLQEQASKAKIRMKNGGIKAPMDQIEEKETPRVNGGTLQETNTMGMTGSARLTKSFGTKSLTRQRMSEAEEEQSYVTFAKEVTEEVLNRGIYTDRVLKKVFDRHVEKNKGTLKISRMRAILDKLRTDFGVSDSPVPFDSEDDDELLAESTLEADPAVREARIARHTGQEQSQDDNTSHHDLQTSENTLTEPGYGQHVADNTLTDQTQLKHTGYSTMNSTDTFNFGSTGEAYSTVRSQPRRGSQLSDVRSEIEERRSLASESRSTVGERQSLASESRSTPGERQSLASESRRTIGERQSLASESRSTIGERRSVRGDQSDMEERRSRVSDVRSEGRRSDAGLGVTGELTATQALDAYQMTIKTRDMQSGSRSASEIDPSEKMSSTQGEMMNGVTSPREMISEPESSTMSSPSHRSQPPVAPRRRRALRQKNTSNISQEQSSTSDIRVASDEMENERGEVTAGDQGVVNVDVSKAIEANTNLDIKSKKEESIAIHATQQKSSETKVKVTGDEQTEEVEDYADDYEDDYDADDDDGVGAASHRTSDDDF